MAKLITLFRQAAFGGYAHGPMSAGELVVAVAGIACAIFIGILLSL